MLECIRYIYLDKIMRMFHRTKYWQKDKRDNRMEKRRLKVCFAASSGGHYEQLLMLKPLMEKYDSFIITEKTSYADRKSVV